MLTRTMIENQNAYLQMITVFMLELLRKENKPILETLQSQPRIKPKPRNKANQNQC
jgi:hypothetical protein